MITAEKIPPQVKQIKAIAIGPFAIFCNGLLKAATVFEQLKNHRKTPIVGFIEVKKEKIYFCRYGFVNDPDIYS